MMHMFEFELLDSLAAMFESHFCGLANNQRVESLF